MQYLQYVLNSVWTDFFMKSINIYGLDIKYGTIYLWVLFACFVVWAIRFFILW